jgi:hypothetical protein
MSAAAGPATATAGIDYSKFQVFFTGVFEDQDKDLVFAGHLGQDPSSATVTLNNGKKSAQRATITLDQFKEYMKRLVKSGVCASNVNDQYIFGNKSKSVPGIFDTNPIRVVLFGPPVSTHRLTRTALNEIREKGGLPVGFLIGRFVEEGRGAAKKKGVYIDVICSFKEAQIGTRFLQYFHHLMAHLDVDFVTLSSLANVVTFYPRLGYEFRADCKEGTPALDKSALEAFGLVSARRPKGPDGKATWPQDTPEALADADYLTFLHHLHKSGLTVNKEGACLDTHMPKEAFAKTMCAIDGFKMAKCSLSAERASRLAGGRRTRRHRRSRRITRRHR